MCGFIGYVKNLKFEHEKPFIDMNLLLKTIRHRGPDHQSFLEERGKWGLGHSRLKIVDMSDLANQPISSIADGSVLVYNGEIYNYKELIKKYSLDDVHRFVSSSDSEIILPLYRKLGVEFLQELNGMFAFAIYNQESGRLILGRDPFGVKPMYYAHLDDGIYFGSEIKSLLAFKEVSNKKNWSALNNYFSLGYFAGEETAFSDIKKLMPGSYLIYDAALNLLEIKKYFDLSAIPQRSAVGMDKLEKICREKVESALRDQIPLDVSLGILLSGGVDSSIISLMVDKYRPRAAHVYTLKFNEDMYDESKHARELAKKFKMDFHEIEVTANEFRSAFYDALPLMDQPSGDPSFVLLYMLSRRASIDVKVLLTGDGGDELFAGYETLTAQKWRKIFMKCPFLKGAMRALAPILPVNNDKLSFFYKMRLFLKGIEKNPALSQFRWRECLSLQDKINLFRGSLAQELKDSSYLFTEKFDDGKKLDEINRLLLIDSTYHLADKVLYKTDLMTMACSLEARVPYTDKSLGTWLFSLPGTIKLCKSNLKYLLRRAFRHDFSRGWLDRKKKGLVAPISRWMRGEWKDWMDQVFSVPDMNDICLDHAAVKSMWTAHRDGRADYGSELFTLLTYIEWTKFRGRQ